VNTEVDVMELDLGVRKFWGKRARPYVGGGVAYIQLSASQSMNGDLGGGVRFSVPVVDEDQAEFGYWLNTGFAYLIGKHFNIGVDVRYSDAAMTFSPELADSDVNLSTGGFQFGW
jgi:opacity protein-like surface antigen